MLCDRVVVGPVADDDDDGVVARNGSEYLRYLAVVDVEGDTAGISWIGSYDADVSREPDAAESSVADA